MSHERQLQESHAAKAFGMDLAERGANDEWKALMYELVVSVAREKDMFTADDVFERLAAMGDKATTGDNRAFGPVMMRAARDRVCKKAGLPQVPSRRKALHATPIEVWQSLIYKPI